MEVAVIGLGMFGTTIATSLSKKGVNVTVFDKREAKIRNIIDLVEDGFVVDSTDEKALDEVGVDHFDKVVVALGKNHLNASLLTVLNLKELGVETIIAKATTTAHYKLLDKIGVNTIVQPEKDMGEKIANRIASLCVLDYIEISDGIYIENIVVKKELKNQVGKTIQEINLRKKFQINIISIKRGQDIIIPESNTIVLEGDVLMIVGKKENLEKFERSFKIK